MQMKCMNATIAMNKLGAPNRYGFEGLVQEGRDAVRENDQQAHVSPSAHRYSHNEPGRKKQGLLLDFG